MTNLPAARAAALPTPASRKYETAVLGKKGLTYNTGMNAKQDDFQNIAVLAHPQIERAAKEAQKVAEFLKGNGIRAVPGILNDESIQEQVEAGVFDLVITLGGDGTVLRAGHLCAPYNIPILAINMGSFGFLIEVAGDDWEDPLERLMKKDYWFEERMMLHASVWRGEECVGTCDVLNDVVIARGDNLKPVHLQASLDGHAVTTYVADALIVSTPTGSTAYALAAGGPILPPELRNILLIPVAPHLSLDRAIVLAEGSEVSVRVLSSDDAVVSGDGQPSLQLVKGDRVDVRASKFTTKLVRFEDANYFYRNLVSLMDQNPSAGAKK